MGGSKDGGKKGNAEYWVDYLMSMHFGICHGPVDALLGIYIKERDAWPGKTVYDANEERTEQINNLINLISFGDLIRQFTSGLLNPNKTTTLAVGPGALWVRRRDLFGGNEKEGGVEGEAYWLPGRDDQVMPEHLAARFGLSSATMVGYRGLASVFFSGGGTKGGFLWQQNNPYLNTVWFTAYRASRGLDQTKQTIQIGDLPPDTNAVNIVYEALTNDDWGMCAPDTILDMASFLKCQNTIFNERFGMSLLWSQQTTVEAFITEILDHIQAVLFVNPSTGLLTLELIRDDYDIATLPRFGPHNCDLGSRNRKAWGETINEINISYTNPASEESETITFQDLANIAMQGGEVVSDTRDYYGIRNKELAAMVGARDIRTASQPLFSTEMETDRSGWDLTPGKCLILDWPEDGLTNMVMRITNVDYGRQGSPSVKVSLLEDIFSLSKAEYTSPPKTEWVDTTNEPKPADYIEIMTVPYAILSRAGVPADDDLYPRVIPGILAASEAFDTTGYVVHGSVVLPNGSTVQDKLTSLAPTARGELAGAMAQQATTTMTAAQLGSVAGAGGPSLAGFALVGSGGDAEMELIMFDSFNATTGVWTIARGILDTVPKAWPVGTPIWYLQNFAVDTQERLAGTTVTYTIQTRSSGGELPLNRSPQFSKLLSARPYLPIRPANVQVSGTGIGAGRRVFTTKASPVVTWAHRNRLMEDTVVRRWGDANVTPEDGQTTRIELLDDAGAVIKTYPGLTGTTFTIPYADMLGGYRFPTIRVRSERNGFVSLQGVDIGLEYRLFGYGNNYGNDYGENNG